MIIKSVLIKICRNIRMQSYLYCLSIVLCFSLSLAIWAYDSMCMTEDKVYNEIGACIELSGNSAFNYDKNRKLTDYLYENNKIIGVNSGRSDFAKAVNFETCKKYKGENPYLDVYENPDERRTADSVVIDGNTRVDFADEFIANKCKLIYGVLPTSELPGAIISQELSQASGLKIGSELKVEGLNGVNINIYVRGIYSTVAEFTVTEDNYLGTAVFAYSPYNRIYTDLETANSLIEYEYISNYSIYYENYRFYDEVMTYIKNAPVDMNEFTFYDQTGTYEKQTFSQLTAIHGISLLAFIIVAVADFVMYIIIFTILKRENRGDIRVLSIIGASSRNIISFQWISFWLLWIPSAIVGFLGSHALYPPLMNFIFKETKYIETGLVSPYSNGTDYVLLNPVISTNWAIVVLAYILIGFSFMLLLIRNKNQLK